MSKVTVVKVKGQIARVKRSLSEILMSHIIFKMFQKTPESKEDIWYHT